MIHNPAQYRKHNILVFFCNPFPFNIIIRDLTVRYFFFSFTAYTDNFLQATVAMSF